ncbi:MAG: HD domain-containing protein [Eubacteriaceae bacterium]|nr:HD domain-containing protein [Eubacteriaceae bacterium]
MNDRLRQQIDFLTVLDREKQIERQTRLTDGSRRENDAEHAWHLAVSALILSEYANEPIDVFKTVAMLLFHDVVEIEAGDTYAYDVEGQKTQKEREQKAADHLYGMLPEDQAQKFRGLWDEFESGDTPEARFARALDRFQPTMQNAAQDGRDWRERGVKLGPMLARNEATGQGSEILWDVSLNEWILPNVRNGNIVDDRVTGNQSIDGQPLDDEN